MASGDLFGLLFNFIQDVEYEQKKQKLENHFINRQQNLTKLPVLWSTDHLVLETGTPVVLTAVFKFPYRQSAIGV